MEQEFDKQIVGTSLDITNDFMSNWEVKVMVQVICCKHNLG